MAADAGQYVFWLDGFQRVLVVVDLVFNAPYVVWLPVHQQSSAGVRRWVKPCQAFHSTSGFLNDVDDSVAAFMLSALQLQAQLFSHHTFSAVPRHDPVSVDGF